MQFLSPICLVLSVLVLFNILPEHAQTGHKDLIQSLYPNVYVGYNIPKAEEKAINKTGGDTTYGEITYDGVQQLLKELQLGSDDVFVDLGSGVGKLVLQVYLETPVKTCIGVELSKTRHDQAVQALTTLTSMGQGKPNQKAEFWNLNFMKADLSQATVVFLNGVAYTNKFNWKIVDKLSQMNRPIRIVSVVPLPFHPLLKELKRLPLTMSWDAKGVITVIYETTPAGAITLSGIKVPAESVK